MKINLSCLPVLFVLHALILKPFTVTINDLCHDSHVCFLLFLWLFLRQLSLCFYIIMVRSTSCFVDLFIALRRSHLYLVFRNCFPDFTIIVLVFCCL
jgi:hypothetical protein